MRKKLLGLFAALSMILTGMGVSFAPTEAQAQSYRSDRGSYSVRRGPGARRYDGRRGYRGYRGRGNRSYRGRSYRSDRGSRYRSDRRGRAYRNYRQDRRSRYYNRRYR